jgi:hypothetical protein
MLDRIRALGYPAALICARSVNDLIRDVPDRTSPVVRMNQATLAVNHG